MENTFTLDYGALHLIKRACMQKKAFTLAEVLITLGIIGVVAALTLPMLIPRLEKIKTEAKLKKFYSVVAQATDKSMVNNGDWSTWDYSLSASDFYEKYYKPQLQTAKTDNKIDSRNIFIVLNDGTCSYFYKNSGTDSIDSFYFGISIDCKSRYNNEGRKSFELGLYNFKKTNIRCNYGPTGCGFVGDPNYKPAYNSGFDVSYCTPNSSAPWKSYECYMKFIQDGMQFKDDYKFYEHKSTETESKKYW